MFLRDICSTPKRYDYLQKLRIDKGSSHIADIVNQLPLNESVTAKDVDAFLEGELLGSSEFKAAMESVDLDLPEPV